MTPASLPASLVCGSLTAISTWPSPRVRVCVQTSPSRQDAARTGKGATLLHYDLIFNHVCHDTISK